ncbi:MAG: hypothetical protein ACTHMU_20865 [Thermomicrobiales bacterium]
MNALVSDYYGGAAGAAPASSAPANPAPQLTASGSLSSSLSGSTSAAGSPAVAFLVVLGGTLLLMHLGKAL